MRKTVDEYEYRVNPLDIQERESANDDDENDFRDFWMLSQCSFI